MTDFQVSTIDGPAAGWHYNTLIEPDRVIWVIDFGDQGGWTRVSAGWPGAIAYTRAAYLPAGIELGRGVIAYVRAETLDLGCSSTHGGSGWVLDPVRDRVAGRRGAQPAGAAHDDVAVGRSRSPGTPPGEAMRRILANETSAMSREEVLDAADSVRGMKPTEVIFDELSHSAAVADAYSALFAQRRGREIHQAAKLSFASATAGSGKIVAAVLYDSNHKCPWWAGLPLIGRRHRCPVWAVDLEA